MNVSKKISILATCIAILLAILIIQDTYAKYTTVANGTTDIGIARWKILVNGQDIRNNSNISQVITPTFIDNDHIDKTIIAPTSKGYFDLIIDCENADVSFLYEITTSPNENSGVKDLVATGFSIDGGEITNFTDTTKISKTVLHSSKTKQINIRVYIEWDDTSNKATMDNTADTLATSSNKPAKLDVNLSFKQIAETADNNSQNQNS